MRKIYCSKCKSEWRKDEECPVNFESSGRGYIVSDIKIQDMVFCPVCLFGWTQQNKYQAKAERVLLREDKIKLTHIVVLGVYGDYIDLPIEEIESVHAKLSRFDPNPDTGEEQCGPQDLRDDWPHAIPMPGGAWLTNQ